MIDIHTHILPQCDDGSQDLETSLKHLRISEEIGITDLVLTPHFMINQYHNTKNILSELFDLLNNAVQKDDLKIKLHLGAEAYLDEKIISFIESENLTINNTKYVLVETGMNSFPANFYDLLFNLVRKGYKPILAHPERYSPIMKNIFLAEDIIRRNVLLQLNAGSFLGFYGNQVQKTVWKLLDNGFAHFLASDNHCRIESHPFVEACDKISEKYDDYLIELLTEINPRRMLNNENIDFFYLEKEELLKENPIKNFFSKISKIIN
ncbi:MAG: capsular biosynthesis protein [Candidatus Cloacimonetes bacterium]|nr:capsular biosynthesis protein [Candidatus Cloacimonadota bacterium]